MICAGFQNNGRDFSAIYAAEAYCRRAGISYGSIQRDAPIGLAWGDAFIAKWRDIPEAERLCLDGRITFPDGDPRGGPCLLEICEPPEGRAAP